ncbi:AraC family transcriptional regulator [Alistipes sp. OttesenSCG-928-B03]|nr:AraC family transcriptional regulator [Alistipes sp. OttesenSCG-928-B03]
MMRLKDRFLYMQEHITCEKYNRNDTGSMADIVELSKGEVYERSLTVPEIVFVCRGNVQVSFRDISDYTLHRRKISLYPSGAHIYFTAPEDSCLFICRLHREVPVCKLLNLEMLAEYTEQGENSFNPLEINDSLLHYMDGFAPHVANGMRCSDYLSLKITELIYLLRAYYTKESLAAFFYPLMAGDFAFRNLVYSSLSGIRSVEQWAQSANMSVETFRKKFNSVFGQSPSSFLIEEKCTLIRHELEYGSKPLKVIAEMFGFSSVDVFQKFYKKHLKMSPGRIRKAITAEK